jgi:hypothetical protein
VDQGAGHATDRFHPCPGGDPHPAPVGMCPGSHALGPQPAQRRGTGLGATTCTTSVVYTVWSPVRSGPPAEGGE